MIRRIGQKRLTGDELVQLPHGIYGLLWIQVEGVYPDIAAQTSIIDMLLAMGDIQLDVNGSIKQQCTPLDYWILDNLFAGQNHSSPLPVKQGDPWSFGFFMPVSGIGHANSLYIKASDTAQLKFRGFTDFDAIGALVTVYVMDIMATQKYDFFVKHTTWQMTGRDSFRISDPNIPFIMIRPDSIAAGGVVTYPDIDIQITVDGREKVKTSYEHLARFSQISNMIEGTPDIRCVFINLNPERVMSTSLNGQVSLELIDNAGAKPIIHYTYASLQYTSQRENDSAVELSSLAAWNTMRAQTVVKAGGAGDIPTPKR